MRTRIKICGVMRPEDGVAAARAGADAIGMIFYPPARRCVSLETAGRILGSLPGFVTPVGLFVDQDVEEILRIAGALRLRTLQLHGHETPETVAALRGFTVLKAIRCARETLGAELGFWREAGESLDLGHLQGFVLETAGSTGGAGIANDWEAIAEAQAAGAFDGLPAIIAAGGLRAETVGEVVRRIRPYAVDVSSGVEAGFGEKSVEKMRAFVDEVERGSRG